MSSLSSVTNTVIGLGAVLSLSQFINQKPLLGAVSSLSTGIVSLATHTTKRQTRNLETLLYNSKKSETATKLALDYADQQLQITTEKLKKQREKSDQLKAEIERLTSLSRDKDTQIKLLDTSIFELQQKNTTLQTQIDVLTQRLAESESVCDHLALEVARLKNELSAHIAELEKANQTIESIRFDEYQLDQFRRERYELKELQCEFESDKKIVEIELSRLTQQLANAESEYNALQAKYESDIDNAFNQGLEVQKTHDKHTIESLQLKIERLQLQIDAKKALQVFNESLGSIAEKISSDYRPIVACGEPRSGKAQIILKAMQSLDSGLGIIPIIYDRSEGGKDGSTWDLAGLPSFSDFDLFMDCLRKICHYGKKRPLIHQSESQNVPPIFIVFDESRTALNGVSDDVIDEFIELFTELKFEMIKHKIILCVTSCSYQIQNMKAGKTQLFNGGDLENVHLFLLNQNIGKFYRDKCPKKTELDEWLELSASQYIAAYVETSGSNLTLSPIKHPTHHGNLRSNKNATSPITNINLAPIIEFANWLPNDYKIEYNKRKITRNSQQNTQQNSQLTQTTQTLESIQGNGYSDIALTDHGGDCVNPQTWKIEDIDIDNIPLLLWNLLGEYTNQSKAILEVFGIKPSGKNKRYLKAREIYRKVKSK